MSECSVLGCQKPVVAKLLCSTHYKRFKRHGNPNLGRPAHWGQAEKHPLWHSHQWFKRQQILCDEWSDFWKFIAGVGDKEEGKRLCRTDQTLSLSPSNFYWKQTIENTGRADYAKKWRVANPEKARNSELKRRFGISLETYNEILESQNGTCSICKQKCLTYDNLSVDHCHKTGRMRGLLCSQCNKGLGHFKDCPQLLEKAIAYLMFNNQTS